MNEKDLERQSATKLRREKPLVFDKITKIDERYQQGIATPIIDIAYSYACNLQLRALHGVTLQAEGGPKPHAPRSAADQR